MLIAGAAPAPVLVESIALLCLKSITLLSCDIAVRLYNTYLYSAKFSRYLYFVDWPLKTISLHNVRGMTAYRKPRL